MPQQQIRLPIGNRAVWHCLRVLRVRETATWGLQTCSATCCGRVCYFKSMRYTAFSTTSSTSFCGQHAQPRCFCIGLANCYFAERGAKRKKGKLNYPVRHKNRKIVQHVRDNLPKGETCCQKNVTDYPSAEVKKNGLSSVFFTSTVVPEWDPLGSGAAVF